MLARLVVEESLFERKKREQQEESKAVEERRGIVELRLRCKRGEKRETEETNIFQRVAKRKKTMQFVQLAQGVATYGDRRAVPTHTLEEEIDMGSWWERTEKQYERLGNFRRVIKINEMMTLRRMVTLGVQTGSS